MFRRPLKVIQTAQGQAKNITRFKQCRIIKEIEHAKQEWKHMQTLPIKPSFKMMVD